LNETLSLLDEFRRTDGELKDLDNLEYEKMFKLNLLSHLNSEDSSLKLRVELKRLEAKQFPNVNRVLTDMQREARRREAQTYESVMRNPRSLGNHLGAVWNFIKAGQLEKALSFVNLIQYKMSRGMIDEWTKQDEPVLSDYILVLEAL